MIESIEMLSHSNHTVSLLKYQCLKFIFIVCKFIKIHIIVAVPRKFFIILIEILFKTC